MKRFSMRLAFVSAAAALLFSPALAPAQKAGFDLLQTAPGTTVDLRFVHLGVVPLKGVPIEACTGNTDTIMRRTQDVPAGGGRVPVEVYALFMKGVNPVVFGKQRADVYVTINNSGNPALLPQPDPLKPSTGILTISPRRTFTSVLDVEADLIFVKAGTNVKDPKNHIGHKAAQPIHLTSNNSTWSPTPFPGYPKCQQYPSGGFYARPKHVGPHPVTPATSSSKTQSGREE